jgi:large conductance mechanosensitive channel
MDLAVGVIIGAAFGKIVTTLVEGVLMPPLGLLLGRVDFSSLFVVLDRSKGIPASLSEAKAQAIPVIAYGQLINDVIGFLIVALAVFLLVKQVNRIKSAIDRPAPSAEPVTKECQFCASTISIKATRCPNCTSQLAPA